MTPDFDLVARALALKHGAGVPLDLDQLEADIAQQLRLAWNGRGEADVAAVRHRMASLVGWMTAEPYVKHVAEVIGTLDR